MDKIEFDFSNKIDEAVRRSEYIKQLKDDYDDEGAIAPPLFIYERSINFLKNYAKDIKNNWSIIILPPEINHGRDGSIDLCWKFEKVKLLINILNQENFEMHYYGDDGNNNNIVKGMWTNENVIDEILASWMTAYLIDYAYDFYKQK